MDPSPLSPSYRVKRAFINDVTPLREGGEVLLYHYMLSLKQISYFCVTEEEGEILCQICVTSFSNGPNTGDVDVEVVR